MTDEIRHLKLGFASLAASVQTGYNSDYNAHVASTSQITFAHTDDGKQSKWVAQYSSITDLELNWFGYRKGSVFEAEIGQRLLLGKRVNAENYISFYEKLPALCITQMPAYAISGTMYFDSKQRILDEEFPDMVFQSEENVIFNGKEQIKIVLLLDTANNVVFFIRKWATHKDVELICKDGIPVAQGSQAESYLPLDTKTLPLF